MLYGAPSMGKSRWFNDWFGGTRVYAVPKSGHRFDQFELQSVVFLTTRNRFRTRVCLLFCVRCVTMIATCLLGTTTS